MHRGDEREFTNYTSYLASDKKKLLRDNFYFSKFDWYVLCRCVLDGIRQYIIYSKNVDVRPLMCNIFPPLLTKTTRPSLFTTTTTTRRSVSKQDHVSGPHKPQQFRISRFQSSFVLLGCSMLYYSILKHKSFIIPQANAKRDNCFFTDYLLLEEEAAVQTL